MRRLIPCIIAIATLLLPAVAWAANSLTVESKTVYAGHQGSQVHILLENVPPLAAIDIPLVLREVTPGAFVTSMQLTFGDRLPYSGGPLGGVRGTWQVADTTGKCRFDGTGWDPDYIDTLPHPVAGAPMDIRFIRGAGIGGTDLPEGSDQTGSFIITADIGTTPGQFEIDTTCILFNHLICVLPSGIDQYVPAFTKGTITIVECDCPNRGDVDQDGFITPIDFSLYVDCLFFCDFPPPPAQCPDQWSPVLTDWDCDGFPTALDLSRFIDYMFAGGDGPCDPCACDPYPDHCP